LPRISACCPTLIPNVLSDEYEKRKHDLRADTAQGFGAKIIPTATDIPEVISLIEESRKSLRQSKEALRRLKMDMKTEHLSFLRKVL
jgi:hypothetical protein